MEVEDALVSGSDVRTNTVVVSAKFTAQLSANAVQITLPQQIPKCFAVRVQHFSIIDDGTPQPITLNGNILLLRSSLCTNNSKSAFYTATSNDQQLLQATEDNTILAWCVNGRKSTTADLYPLGLPQNNHLQFFESDTAVQRFFLEINNITSTMQPHTSSFVMEVVMDIYSRV